MTTGIRFLYDEISYFLRKIKLALIYFLSLFFCFMIIVLATSIPIDFVNIATFLSLNYIPRTLPESLAVIIVFFMELAPIMAFVEVRTLTQEEKGILRAKNYRDHIVLVGCGQLGKRIASLLLELGFPFTLIVLRRDIDRNEFVNDLLHNQDVPVIPGDGSVREVLLQAKIDTAQAIIIAVRDDLLNHKIAYRAKRLAPNVRVIARVYDDEMGTILRQSGYADEVLSATAISVKNYLIGSVVDVVTELDTPLLVRVTPDMIRTRKTHNELEKELGVDILAIFRDNHWIHDGICIVEEGDVICIQAPKETLKKMLKTRPGHL